MQKDFYDKLDDPMYSNSPKVNSLKELNYIFEGHKGLVLEFGCGLGRNLVVQNHRFDQIDGCDLNSKYLDRVRQNCKDVGIATKLYLTDGVSLGGIPDNTYDLVFSITVLEHISVYEIRFNILQDMYRVLKKGGWISIQMGYGNGSSPRKSYYDNYLDAVATNSGCDVQVDDTEQIEDDLKKIGFKNFQYKLVGDIERVSDGHDQWIMFKAQK